MNENFIRTYSLIAGDSKIGNGFEIGDDTDDIHALHVTFSIEKSSASEPNTAKVQIWNVSPQNLKILEQKDCSLFLKAGYAGFNDLVLAGNITSATTTDDNSDRMTELEVVDGRVALTQTFISLSYTGKTNSKRILDAAALEMGCSIIYSQSVVFADLQNGFAYVGTAKNGFDKLCKKCGLTWSIQNGVIQVRNPGEAITTLAYQIDSSSGLISVPKRITLDSDNDSSSSTKSKSDKSSTGISGYEIEYLMNGAIGVNDLIKLVSKEVTGYFRVNKVQIDGDNLSGDWKCTAQILEVT